MNIKDCFSVVRVISGLLFLTSSLMLFLPGVYNLGVVFLFLVSIWILSFSKVQLRLRRYDWIFIGLMGGYFLLSSILNFYHHLPLNSYDLPSRFLIFIPIYLLLIACPPNSFALWRGVCLGSGLAGIIAIVQQYFFYREGVWGGRAQGFLDPIQFGDIAILLASLSACYFFFFNGKRSKLENILILLAVCLGVLGSVLSGSRGGWLTLPFVLFLFYFFSDKLTRSLIKNISIVIALIILISSFLLTSKYNFIGERLSLTAQELSLFMDGQRVDGHSEGTSYNVRVKMWENGILAFRDRPICGWGDLQKLKENYPAEWYVLNKIDNFNHLHNEIIDTMAKKGLLGLLVLFAVYFIPFVYFYRMARKFGGSSPIAGMVLIGCVAVFGLSQSFFSHNSGVMVFLYFLVLFFSQCRLEEAPKKS